MDGYKLKSTLIGARSVHSEMLEFAALHNIRPTIEEYELSEEGIAEALGRLTTGKLRYRGVFIAI